MAFLFQVLMKSVAATIQKGRHAPSGKANQVQHLLHLHIS